MKSKGLVVLLSSIIVLIVLAIVVSNKQEEQVADDQSGKVFLAGLSARVNDIAEIEVRSGESVATAIKKEEVWVLKERFDYPVDISSVKQLILKLADLKTVEEKTSKEENYAKLGVQDPSSSTGNKFIEFRDAGGAKLVSVILGDVKGKGMYARKQGDKKAWLVDGRVDTPGSLSAWLEKTIVDIAGDKVKSVKIKNIKKKDLFVSKDKQEDKDFVVKAIPKGKELKSASVANSLSTNLARLPLSDVVLHKDFKGDESKAVVAEYTLFDHKMITAKIFSLDDKDYLTLAATQLEGAADDIKAEVEKMNQGWAPWAFEIQSFKAKAFRKTMDDMVKSE